ncbi:hypothetical protein QA612_04030 [Evansella sp. AB-P1]|uniref:hypothetical protein n=1 Tax=Evansella sp. AB-P1 TaxID=3037653 RepID=UPI00241D079E|nr:hypothetical protein [Evansella sp. AB-P1]MDG5786648.1 hypothetical protein [Evansella sp. AB-P1]
MPQKKEKLDCGHGRRSPCSCKRRKASLQGRRKPPLLLQKEKSRFAGTGEEAPVPAKGEK